MFDMSGFVLGLYCGEYCNFCSAVVELLFTLLVKLMSLIMRNEIVHDAVCHIQRPIISESCVDVTTSMNWIMSRQQQMRALPVDRIMEDLALTLEGKLLNMIFLPASHLYAAVVSLVSRLISLNGGIGECTGCLRLRERII